MRALLISDQQVTEAFSTLCALYRKCTRRGWLAGDWPSMGGVLNTTAVAWTAGFQWWHSGDISRTQNVSKYMPVLALCLVITVIVVSDTEFIFQLRFLAVSQIFLGILHGTRIRFQIHLR